MRALAASKDKHRVLKLRSYESSVKDDIVLRLIQAIVERLPTTRVET